MQHWEQTEDDENHYIYIPDRDIHYYIYDLPDLIEMEICLYDVFSLHCFTVPKYSYTDFARMKIKLLKDAVKMAERCRIIRDHIDTSDKQNVRCIVCGCIVCESGYTIYQHFEKCQI